MRIGGKIDQKVLGELFYQYMNVEDEFVTELLTLPTPIGRAFINEEAIEKNKVEAAGLGIDTKDHAATMTLGKEGVIHGMNTKVVQEEDGTISPVYSISAGLDYPGVGPEHAYLADIGRVEYRSATDKEAVDAFLYLSKTEGIIPAIESAHAIAEAMKLAPTLEKEQIIVINVSGRGDKDVDQINSYLKQ